MRCHFASLSRKLYRDITRDLATVVPADKPAAEWVSSARRRRPSAFQLARSLEDRVFEIGFDPSCNRRFGPLAVRAALLAVDRHRQRVGVQCPRQDEDIDPVTQIWVVWRRIPIGNDRAGKRILGGVFDEI